MQLNDHLQYDRRLLRYEFVHGLRAFVLVELLVVLVQLSGGMLLVLGFGHMPRVDVAVFEQPHEYLVLRHQRMLVDVLVRGNCHFVLCDLGRAVHAPAGLLRRTLTLPTGAAPTTIASIGSDPFPGCSTVLTTRKRCASEPYMPPYFFRHARNVAELMAYFRQSSGMGTSASAR